MSLKLISATPSPYARINRIAMIEKGIPFELQNEIPWHKEETQTPKYNPLEKLPVLIFPDGQKPIYDSSHIQEYIVQKYAQQGPKLITGDLDTDLQLRQVQVLSQGVMDAIVLAFFEKARETKSEEWLGRQTRKIYGGFTAFEELAKAKPKGSDYLFNNELTIADIAVVCAVGFGNFNGAVENWQQDYPHLAAYWEKLEEADSFKSTRPVMFDIRSQEII